MMDKFAMDAMDAEDSKKEEEMNTLLLNLQDEMVKSREFRETTIELVRKIGESTSNQGEGIKTFIDKQTHWMGTVDTIIDNLKSRLSLMEAQVDELNKLKEKHEKLDGSLQMTDRILALFLTPKFFAQLLAKAEITLTRNGMDDPEITDEEKKVMEEYHPTFPETIQKFTDAIMLLKEGLVIMNIAVGDEIYEDIVTKLNDTGISPEDVSHLPPKEIVDKMMKAAPPDTTLSSLADRVEAIEAKVNQ